jgi:preprotein translocase subunit SecF
MKFRPFFYAFSITLLTISLFSIFKWGFKSSIDFAGGSVWSITLPNKPSTDQINEVFKKSNLKITSIVSLGNQNYSLKFDNISPDQKSTLDKNIKIIDKDAKELKFETLGPILGKELLQKTIVAIILAALCLFVFIGRRFKDFSFGISAVLAMFHDAIILMGSFSLFGHFFGAELDALFVTALLTTLSSSVHDTVITFDRIRELKRQNFKFEWVDLANRAVTEVLNRTINNSMTIILVLLSLVLLGGQSTHWFSTALLVGFVCGTYSSTGVAIPLMLMWKKHINKKI